MIHPGPYQCLGELLQDALVQWKTETALIETHRRSEKQRYSYLEFRDAAMPVAARLQAAGVGAGDRVAILMSNQSRWLISAYAALFRGAIIVPLDYKLTADEQAALLAHAKPAALIVEHAMFRRFTPGQLDVPLTLVSEAPEGASLGSAEAWEGCQEADFEAPAFVMRTRDDAASIVYSSGTGGRPKGCMLTHDNYLEQLRSLAAMYPMEPGDRYFSILPTNHAIDFMCGFIGPLTGGATVVHQRTLRPEFIRHTMRTQCITHMALVPLVLEAFERTIRERLEERSSVAQAVFGVLGGLNERLTRREPNVELSRRLLKPVHDAFGGHLKLLFCGGAFVDRSRAEFFYKLGIPVAIGYGLTEACTVLTVNDLKPFRGDSVGRAVDGVEIRIEDQDSHGVGHVVVRSRTVMKGYLDDPELTAETIKDGWLHTGDLGWLDASGHLHLVGRAKNMIVTAGGKNIYPEDVEAAFDGIPCEEYAVFASNYLWPEEKLTEERLLAVVRPKGNDTDVRQAVSERNGGLPDFKRVRGVLTWDGEFPRTASMKLKRDELARQLRAAAKQDAIQTI